MLVINTVDSAKPRLVGGGLDDPATVAAAAEQRSQPRAKRLSPITSADTSYFRQFREPPPCTQSEWRSDASTPATTVGAASSPAEEHLTAVHDALLALIPPLAAHEPTIGLVLVLAAKLDGHVSCASLINPAPGVSIDDVRARCRAWLFAMSAIERLAVLTMLMSDAREAT